MASFLTWLAGVVQDAIVGVSGGSIVLQVMFGLLGLMLILWRFQVSMPLALMVSFFALAVLSQSLTTSFDPVLGNTPTGINHMLFLIVVFMSGVLLWHLLFKKSQAGTG